MLKKLRGLFGGGASAAPAAPVQMPPVQADRPHYIIGDVHGCAGLLDRLHTQIEADHKASPTMKDAVVVHIGDYVDRGEESADVLGTVFRLTQADPDHQVALKGNHEKMLLDFLDDPEKKGKRWLRYGGLQTLASFGVRGITERADRYDRNDAAAEFRAALPDGMEAWLRALPTLHRSGNLVCVHAGLDPAKDIAANDDVNVHLWGHPDFMTTPRRDGQWIAHGHTITDTADQVHSRIQLDTGAYATGVLSAVAVGPGRVEFLDARM